MAYAQFNRIATQERHTVFKNYKVILLDPSRFNYLIEGSVYFKVISNEKLGMKR